MLSAELIAILGVGVALAGFIWQGLRSLRADLVGRMDRMEGRSDSRMDRIEDRMTELGDRVSRIEGMLHQHFGRNEPPAAE